MNDDQTAEDAPDWTDDEHELEKEHDDCRRRFGQDEVDEEDDEEVDAGSPARAREHRPHERPLLARLLAEGARSLRRALNLLVPRLLLAGEHARFQL